jgi:hypothetical protein
MNNTKLSSVLLFYIFFEFFDSFSSHVVTVSSGFSFERIFIFLCDQKFHSHKNPCRLKD